MQFAAGFLVALALLGAAAANPAKTQFYRGHKVLSVTPKSAEELATLKELEANEDLELDFWTDPVAVGKEVNGLSVDCTSLQEVVFVRPLVPLSEH